MRPSANPAGNPRSSMVAAPPPPENMAGRPDIPPVPSSLGSVGERVWFEVWEAGGEAYNPVTDAYIVERYASLQERRQSLMEMLSAEGYVTVGSQGQVVAHPAARLLQDVESKLLPLEDRLGLSPEARIRLGIGALEHKSRLDLFREQEDSLDGS